MNKDSRWNSCSSRSKFGKDIGSHVVVTIYVVWFRILKTCSRAFWFLPHTRPLCPCWCPILCWLAKRWVESRHIPVVAWCRGKPLGEAHVAVPRILLHCWRLWTGSRTRNWVVLIWERWKRLPRRLRRAWVSHQSTLPNALERCEVLGVDFPVIQLRSRLVPATW